MIKINDLYKKCNGFLSATDPSVDGWGTVFVLHDRSMAFQVSGSSHDGSRFVLHARPANRGWSVRSITRLELQCYLHNATAMDYQGWYDWLKETKTLPKIL